LVEAGTQNLTFDQNGALVDDNSGTAIDFTFGATVLAPQPVTFDFGTGTGETPAGTGLDGSSQFSADFSVVRLSQNGYGAGFLKSVAVSEDGVITGIFTNGQTRQIGQIALAKFVAPTELTKAGRNLFAESFDSGQPIVGAAGTSGIGRTLSNALELSNVDLAEEFEVAAALRAVLEMLLRPGPVGRPELAVGVGPDEFLEFAVSHLKLPSRGHPPGGPSASAGRG